MRSSDHPCFYLRPTFSILPPHLSSRWPSFFRRNTQPTDRCFGGFSPMSPLRTPLAEYSPHASPSTPHLHHQSYCFRHRESPGITQATVVRTWCREKGRPGKGPRGMPATPFGFCLRRSTWWISKVGLGRGTRGCIRWFILTSHTTDFVPPGVGFRRSTTECGRSTRSARICFTRSLKHLPFSTLGPVGHWRRCE